MPGAIAMLDRDGTLNVKAPEGEYVTSPDQVVLLPGAAEAIRGLNDAGVPVAVISNQRGVALGRMTEADVRAVNVRLGCMISDASGGSVDLWLFCPHASGTCECRKPRPGMLLDALEWFDADASRSVMIGDAESDVEAGRAASVGSIRVGGAHQDLLSAVKSWLRYRKHSDRT